MEELPLTPQSIDFNDPKYQKQFAYLEQLSEDQTYGKYFSMYLTNVIAELKQAPIAPEAVFVPFFTVMYDMIEKPENPENITFILEDRLIALALQLGAEINVWSDGSLMRQAINAIVDYITSENAGK